MTRDDAIAIVRSILESNDNLTPAELAEKIIAAFDDDGKQENAE